MELLETDGFANLLKVGRWALAAIETGLSLFLAIWFQNRPMASWMAMGTLFVYNCIVLLLIHRLPLSKTPVKMLIALDLIFLTNACIWTNGIASPFLGQFYLIVFVSALFFDLRGGLLAGVFAGLLTVGIAISDVKLNGIAPDWKIMRDTAPYFTIVGGFTGFLVREMKRWFGRYRESLQKDVERRQVDEARTRELELAREIQRSSLPTEAPIISGLQLALRSEPSREVGGDLHVFVADPSGTRIGVAVGDVSGKGIAAALVATSIGYLLPYLSPLAAPHAALLRLNKDLCERLPEAAFATLIYAEISPENNAVTIWNAGHPAAILWRARTQTLIESPEGDSPPLGLFPAWRTPSRLFPFDRGDLLVLYSDGVFETRSASGEPFGHERLSKVIATLAPHGADAVADGIRSAVRAHGIPNDDATVIVCQRIASYPGV
jgi:serine phosphatase RsbU (regulator of sigma subunit)